MKKPILHLDRLTPADLGKFSVLLSQTLNNRQRAALNTTIPDIMAQIGAFDGPAKIPQPEVMSTQVPGRGITGPEWKKLEEMARTGQLIQCIKEVRSICGISLKEAKDFMDKHLRPLYTPRDSGPSNMQY